MLKAFRKSFSLSIALIAMLTLSIGVIGMQIYSKDRVDYKPLICVYLYVWYDNTTGRHWSHVLDKPVVGFYRSIDDSLIRWQLERMVEAGIDCVFISWWGPNSYEDRAAEKVFYYLELYGLKGAILIEPFLGEDPGLYDEDFWSSVLRYIEVNYIEKFRDTYLELYGKPLILAFLPVGLSYRPHSDRYTIRIVGTWLSLTYSDWDLYPYYLAPYTVDREVTLKIRRDGYVAIAPRFDDRHLCEEKLREGCELRVMDPDYRLKLYVKEWEWILDHLDKVRIVAIYSWNEYHERSEIEPHVDATSVDPSYDPYKITKLYIAKLRSCTAINRGIEVESYRLSLDELVSIVYILFLVFLAITYIL